MNNIIKYCIEIVMLVVAIIFITVGLFCIYGLGFGITILDEYDLVCEHKICIDDNEFLDYNYNNYNRNGTPFNSNKYWTCECTNINNEKINVSVNLKEKFLFFPYNSEPTKDGIIIYFICFTIILLLFYIYNRTEFKNNIKDYLK